MDVTFLLLKKKNKYDMRKLLCIGMKIGGVQRGRGRKRKSIFSTILYLAPFYKNIGLFFL